MDPVSSRHKISVMSYNLLFNNKSKGQAIEVIEKENADVVMVQEMTHEWHEKLLGAFKLKYPYRYLYPDRGVRGLGVFSKYPMSKKCYVFSDNRKPLAQVVDLNLKGTNLSLVNVHLASPAVALENPDNFLTLYLENYKKRTGQWSRLHNELKNNWGTDVVIAGDFNTMPIEPLYQEITSDYVDADHDWVWWRSATFPNVADKTAILPLDYFFLQGELAVDEFEVIEGGSSDHFAIKAVLTY